MGAAAAAAADCHTASDMAAINDEPQAVLMAITRNDAPRGDVRLA
jgi:hypothetical protein